MDQYEWLRLDAQLCFRLYAASRSITRCYQPLLAELDVTYPQYLVLMVLWEHGTSTVKGIGQRLMLDSGTLTPLLKRMEQTGLISRKRSAADEREVQIALTDAGLALRERAVAVPPALFDQMGMPLEDLKQLRTLLDQLIENTREKS
ncbi:MAG: MarR family transcriptional regulator [Burkholderiales bacterium]|nr:MarR family transcriptional regulator [Burkholderiales bacterium]